MKSMFHWFFLIMVSAVVACGQACERTLIAGSFVGAPAQLGPEDLEATLGHQILRVTKVEPVVGSRLLVLIAADYNHRVKEKDFNEATQRLASMDGIPPDVSVAYGVYAEKIVFSSGFSSDPSELRKSLADLVRTANSGSLGQINEIYYLLNQALDYFQEPRPGDSIVLIDPIDTNQQDYAYLKAQKEHLEPVREERFLESAIRLFSLVGNHSGSPERHEPMAESITEATGGLESNGTGLAVSKNNQELNWRTALHFLMVLISHAYQVTVEIPAGTKTRQWGWRLKLSDAARNRLRLPKGAFPFAYPDLLLCDKTAKDRVATAVRPRY